MGRCRPVSDSEADSMEAHCDGPEELALIRFFRHTAYRSRSYWIPGSWNLRMVYTGDIPFYDP
jgi:hypothetical protein